jgi:RecB family exonuclease
MACAKMCLKRHFYAYEVGLRPARDGDAITIGKAFHVGLETFSGSAASEFDAAVLDALKAADTFMSSCSADPYDTAIHRVIAQRLLHAYLMRYREDGLNVVAVEREFNLPLVNPDTGAESRTFCLAGKIDRIVELPDGRLAVMETKTTSIALDDGSDYWARLRLDSQISLYVYAARTLGFDVQTVLYDVTRKPAIAPLRATPSEKRRYTRDGKLYGNQRERDETPDEFAERLTSDIASRPEFYFARREIPRLEADLTEAQAEWWQQAHLLRDCQRSGRWFRNTSSCLQPYRCPYTEICFAGAHPEDSVPSGFVQTDNIHPELKGANSDGYHQPA